MTISREWIREVSTFLVTAGIVLLLLLLVVVPTHSQITPPAPSPRIEIVAENPAQNMMALFIVIAAQMILLWTLMISYLRIAHKVSESRHVPVHHWWNRVHLHLR